MRARQDESEQRVTPLELIFDLVFVFAITQVTGFLADNSTWRYSYARTWIRSHRGAFTMEEAAQIAPRRGRNAEGSADPD